MTCNLCEHSSSSRKARGYCLWLYILALPSHCFSGLRWLFFRHSPCLSGTLLPSELPTKSLKPSHPWLLRVHTGASSLGLPGVPIWGSFLPLSLKFHFLKVNPVCGGGSHGSAMPSHVALSLSGLRIGMKLVALGRTGGRTSPGGSRAGASVPGMEILYQSDSA